MAKPRSLPLPVPDVERIGKPTNIYIGDPLKFEAAEVARSRYGWSLSKLARELLTREIRVKTGLVHAEIRKPRRKAA